MLKLLLCATLMMPLASCGKNSPGVVSPKITSCEVPPLPPPPDIGFQPCADQSVCIGIGDAVELGKWVANVHEVELAIEACSLVHRQ